MCTHHTHTLIHLTLSLITAFTHVHTRSPITQITHVHPSHTHTFTYHTHTFAHYSSSSHTCMPPALV